MYSIQEMISKTETQRREVKKAMEQNNAFHIEDANIFNGQKRSVTRELSESLKKIGLTRLLEYLAKSGTTDIAGAAYLVPDAVSQTMYHAAKQYDITPLISQEILTQWTGGVVDVQVAKDEQYKPKFYGSGGELPDETTDTVQATLTPVAFGINTHINNELLEDQQYNLIEWHMQKGAMRLASFASDLALEVLAAAPDGDGTLNTVTTANGDETVPQEILDGFDANSVDEFISNTMIITPESWGHSVCGIEVAGGAAGDYWRVIDGITGTPPAPGFHLKWHCFDVLFSTSIKLCTGGAGTAMTACKTILFDRNNALLTARKRWLQIDNYSEPIDDLAGAVISARQDSVSIYKDSICTITETT